ncbi:2-amino-4-hydroxy-6-hydroxymethyldihydropteridine diphosphokinase [Tepiditoga spiralis]|uniref:2-amino-4-hydroxy-6-hydroxymethyldihydropteridine diphosphokinase n=1 Tax=Tepiditoga spiralis TaxID=2108365 RepID=A0A7G1G9Q4_9BACT|nr:2-amino-4-hydroxy-6-hydroxymethyldihydropteridine diphosphokinase [Tepiditoga spiralis]BBE31723.1 2-amino-4-hydroxy-6-hydroxymethyldihydropteridine diphosphokinase [Tepiditoga spiralis]
MKSYLSLGSNMGNTKKNIDSALQKLQQDSKINITKKSSYYKTEPVGYKNQEWFLNIVIEIETTYTPYELLKKCNEIEKDLKRKRIIRWGPRTIDIDILLYENFTSNDKKLTVPHPRMTERGFVMIPLFEIVPEIKINNKPIKTYMKKFDEDVIKIKD